MPAVTVVDADGGEWFVTRDVADTELLAKMSDGELSAHVRVHHPGSDDTLQLFEVRVPPDTEFTSHAHATDEIILVLGGDMRLGARTLTAGASVYVPAMTLYSFRAGPAGLSFANFRGRSDTGYITKSEFMARREEARR